MTSNQINYANLLRQRSFDREMLEETRRANLAKERLEKDKNDLSKLNARATINYNMSRLREDRRHNIAQENKDLIYMNRSLSEQERHNKASEALQSDANYITSLRDLNNYNLGMSNLNENVRHAMAMEANQSRLTDIQKFQTESHVALANREQTQSALLDYSKLQETERANKAREEEAARHNRAVEFMQAQKQTADAVVNASREANQWFRAIVSPSASR